MKPKTLMIIIICVVIINSILYIQFKGISEAFSEKQLPDIIARSQTPNHEKDIPFLIHMIWHTKTVKENMYNNVMNIALKNPEFTIHIYDIELCEKFIKDNYDNAVLQTFRKLKPYAYKSDLMRLCIMYKVGGVYMDMKYDTLKPLKEYVSRNETMFAKNDNEKKVFNGFFIIRPNDAILKKCIDKIVEHVKNNYYGEDPLWPTGPGLIGDVMYENNYTVPNSIIHFELKPNNIHSIIDKRTKETIIQQYPQYRSDQSSQNHIYYLDQWNSRDIYN